MYLLVVGTFLICFWWILAWTQISPLAVYYFTPLWLGYIFLVNGLCELAYGDSLIRRMGWWFLTLFIFSVSLWWFFEYLNTIVQNWHYIFPEGWSQSQQVLLKTISFSTVIPAVYSTSFFFYLFLRDKLKPYAVYISARGRVTTLVLGFLTFSLILIYPRVLFPFVWVAPLLILDVLNNHLGFPSILNKIRQGEWAVITAFALGTLLTGFFWEMWNFYAFPKWFYTIPYFDFLKIFEMPILGYGGYIFFGLFVFTFTSMVFGLMERLGIRERLKIFE